MSPSIIMLGDLFSVNFFFIPLHFAFGPWNLFVYTRIISYTHQFGKTHTLHWSPRLLRLVWIKKNIHFSSQNIESVRVCVCVTVVNYITNIFTDDSCCAQALSFENRLLVVVRVVFCCRLGMLMNKSSNRFDVFHENEFLEIDKNNSWRDSLPRNVAI